MRHLEQCPSTDHGDVLVDDDLEQYELEVDRLDPALQSWPREDPRLASPFMRARRVVTGEVDGRAAVVSDEAVDPVTISLMPGNEFLTVWGADEAPTLPADGSPSARNGYFPPATGYRFIIVTLAPASPPDESAGAAAASPAPAVDMAAAMAEVEAKLPGLVESLDPDHPGMHRTATVDFDVIVSGEAWLGLDDGVEVLCRKGDCVVVNGQRHTWVNKGAEPCVMVSACIGGPSAAS